MYQRAVAISQFTNLVRPGDIAVHGKHAVATDQLEARASGVRCLELSFEVGHIVVAVAIAAGLAQGDAVDDAGVVQFIRDGRIFFTEEGFEQAAVGVEAGGVENGVFCAQECAERLFQLFAQRLITSRPPLTPTWAPWGEVISRSCLVSPA